MWGYTQIRRRCNFRSYAEVASVVWRPRRKRNIYPFLSDGICGQSSYIQGRRICRIRDSWLYFLSKGRFWKARKVSSSRNRQFRALFECGGTFRGIINACAFKFGSGYQFELFFRGITLPFRHRISNFLLCTFDRIREVSTCWSERLRNGGEWHNRHLIH